MNIFEHIPQAVSLEQFTLDAVNFIAQEFGFSFVGLFLVDAPREHAVFQTGTGNAGLMIKKRNYKVPLSCDLQEFDGLVCESINKNAICCLGATLVCLISD